MHFRSVQERSLHADGLEELSKAGHRQSDRQEWSHDHCCQLLASRQLHRAVHSQRVSSLQAALMISSLLELLDQTKFATKDFETHSIPYSCCGSFF